MSELVISGYYGFDNLGDEAILAAIVYGLNRREKYRITVLSANPGRTAARYPVKAVNRNSPAEVMRALNKSRVLISGGGSLLQDVTGWKTIPYYLSQVYLAQLLGKKTVFYAQGIGPVQGRLAQLLIKKIANRTDQITVRDLASKDLLLQFGVKEELIEITADPVFIFKKNYWEKGAQLLEKIGLTSEKKIIGISVRPWGDNRYLPELARAAERLAATTGYQVLIIPFHYQQDLAISRQLQGMITNALLLTTAYSPLEMLEIFAQLDFLIGVRFHSLVLQPSITAPLLRLIMIRRLMVF